MGAQPPPPPGPAKSMGIRGFSGPAGAEPPPGKKKKINPPTPGQIPDNAPESEW